MSERNETIATVVAARAEGVSCPQAKARLEQVVFHWIRGIHTAEEVNEILADQFDLSDRQIDRLWLLFTLTVQMSRSWINEHDCLRAVNAFVGQKKDEGGFFVALRYGEDGLDGAVVADDFWNMDRNIGSAEPVRFVEASNPVLAADFYLASAAKAATMLEVVYYTGKTCLVYDWTRHYGMDRIPRAIVQDPTYRPVSPRPLMQTMTCGTEIVAQVNHDTSAGWRCANSRLAERVVLHLENCGECADAAE